MLARSEDERAEAVLDPGEPIVWWRRSPGNVFNQKGETLCQTPGYETLALILLTAPERSTNSSDIHCGGEG